MRISVIIIFCACILSAQGLLDNEILDIELNENLIVVGSKSGVSWKLKDGGVWESVNCKPFLAKNSANLDNIVLGENGFAVRLDLETAETVRFLHSDLKQNPILEKEISKTKTDMQLYGYDGFFHADTFFFALGDGGVASLSEIFDTVNRNGDFCVNSVAGNYKTYDFLALSPNGKIWGKSGDVFNGIDSIELQKSELAVKFIKDFNNSSILILTADPSNFGNDKLYRRSEESEKTEIFKGDISKAAVTPDGFIYILDGYGRLSVREIDGEQTQNSQKRQDILQRRIAESNFPSDYRLTDISIFGDSLKYSIGFSSDKGVLYSPDEKKETPFEYFYKPVPLKHGLKQVYAEPGILSASGGDRFCTFEYSLEKDDNVTIDIFNYNLDFVCRIVENALRPSAKGNEHSTVKGIDRWDGTVNNRGGRPVSPGVYYFKITTQKTKLSTFGKVIVARN